MSSKKTLADFISCGRHEFVAFARDRMSLSDTARSNCDTIGNDLGNIFFGILVCDKSGFKNDNFDAKLFYKSEKRYDGDSDIHVSTLKYHDAEVISEVPLSLDVSFWSGNTLKARTNEFREARSLLRKYGIY